MKSLIVILVICFTYTSATDITTINIIGLAKQIELDSYSNKYVQSVNGLVINGSFYDRFYKLDENNNIVVSQDFYNIQKIIINQQDEAFIFVIESPSHQDVESVYYLQPNSTKVEFLFDFDVTLRENNGYVIDHNDNIYFNAKSGVIFFSSSQQVPLPIKNLNDYYFDYFAVDSNDNVYLVTTSSQTRFVALITEEGKKPPTPYAMIISNFGAGVVDKITIWQDLPFVTDKDKNLSGVKQVLRTGTSPVLTQYDVDHELISTGDNDRLLVIGKRELSSYFHYITPVGEVVNVKGRLRASEFQLNGLHAVDSNGTAYLANANKNGQILVLKCDESELREINIPSDDVIRALEIDDEDNLWVLTDKLFVLRNGQNLEQVTDQVFIPTFFFMRIDDNANKIYISTFQGLFEISNY